MSKFYAVKVGKIPGIYYDWNTTQTMVKGYPGAIFKSFTTLKEAQDFINPNNAVTVEPDITIYTDGSAKDGIGGAGVIVLAKDVKYKAYGRVPQSIDPIWSDRAELYAIYIALSLVPQGNVRIYSDSQYVVGSFSAYVRVWAKDNWRTNSGAVANLDYVQACYQLMQNRNVELVHVYSHTGNLLNEEVDKLAEMGRINPDYNVVVYQNYVRIR